MIFRVWGFFCNFLFGCLGWRSRDPAVGRVGWPTEAGISAAAVAGTWALRFSERDSEAGLSFGF